MSLINDALKRARDVDRERRGAPPAPPLRPVEHAAQARPRSWWPILVLVVVALSLSVWSFSRWARPAPLASGGQLANASRETLNPLPETTPIATPVEQPTSSHTALQAPLPPGPAPQPSPSTIPVISETASSPTSLLDAEPLITPLLTNAPPAEAPATPTAETPPPLTLQSILYRPRHPAVVINGQFLHEGDTIADARIIKIERQQVTLEGKETNIVLSMPRY